MNPDTNSGRLVHESETTESATSEGCVRWILTTSENQRTYRSGLVLGGISSNEGTRRQRSIRHLNCVRGSKRHSGDRGRKA